MLDTTATPPQGETHALIAALIGLGGALAGAAVSWLNNSSATAQRMRVYQEATGRVTFWDGWLKARLATCSSPEEAACLQARVQKELSVAVEYVEAVVRGETARAAYHVERQKLHHVRQWFLLYNPSHRSAWTVWVPWILRIIFFLLLFAAPAYLLSWWKDEDFKFKSMVTMQKLTPWVISLALIIFAWLFRGIAIMLEKPPWNDREGRYTAIDELRAK